MPLHGGARAIPGDPPGSRLKLVTIPGVGGVTHVKDPDGFSIELLTLTPAASRWFGVAPRPTPMFAPFLPRDIPRDPER